MEALQQTKKPHYSKGTNVDVFQMLRADVKEIVRDLEPKRKWESQFKAFLFPLMYIGLWAAAMIWGKQYPLVYFGA